MATSAPLELPKQQTQSREPCCPICAAAAWGNTLDQRHVWWLSVMGRLKPDWTPAQAAEHLRTLSSGLFEFKADPYRPDRARFVHCGCTTQGKPPVAIPARFVVACPHAPLIQINDRPASDL